MRFAICILLMLWPYLIAAQTKGNEKAMPFLQIKCTSVSTTAESISISIELRNNGDSPLLVATKPRLRNATYHHYVAVSRNEPEMLETSSQVFKPPFPTPYSDSTAVLLQSLLPGEQFKENLVLRFPLRETIPPKGSTDLTDPKESPDDISYGKEVRIEQIKKVKVIYGHLTRVRN